MKKTTLIIFYFILTLYSVESLLFLFHQKKSFSMNGLKNKRIEIAKKKGLEFDNRSPKEAFLEIRKENNNLEPKFFYSPIFRFSETFRNAKEKNNLIPFRGPINSKTLSCAEEGKYNLNKSDKFGFKNSNDIYKKKINTILLGDSFAEGDCQNIENDIAGNLNKLGFRTANFGVVGTSVLVPLGIMREFGPEIMPRNFIYLYAEENDFFGLNWSKKDSHLMNYLKDEYSIDYLNRYDEVQKYLKLSSQETISYLKSSKQNGNKNSKSKFKVLKDNLIDILEMKRVKRFVRYKILNKKHIETDLDLFFLVIKKMDEEAKKNDSRFIFVYTPSSARYFSKPGQINPEVKQQMELKKIVLEGVRKMNIVTVDLTVFLDSSSSVQQYFSLGYFGHFNAEGYKKVAEIISSELN
ncbi:MAG: hypothetical protein CBC88_02985 [Candidatus Pelagibacter sp. TMED128]|nr:MAG: hypothetical protein CBC88_02985 [Candidatus Pelagibacter sp. TMED128]|tara:strand:+ start:5106 stop:6332 length:1227 start_codon:yes stop_codon:yes gene_type:complete